MIWFNAFLLAAAGALALPASPKEPTGVEARGADVAEPLMARDGTPSSNGVHDGYYYSFWSDDAGGTVNYRNGDKGSYSVDWQNCSNFYGGKGWNPGKPRTINFNGTFTPSGNGFLSIYGQTTNPRVEYYIVESFGTFDPSTHAQDLGTFESDGSTYKLARQTRYYQWPSDTLHQYYSVRQTKRSSGSVDVGNHFRAWKEKGLKFGEHDFQILAAEGFQSSGVADMTVW